MHVGLVDGIVDNDPATANAADECARHVVVLVYNTYERRESEFDSHVHDTHHPTISPVENVVATDRGFSFFSRDKLSILVAFIQPIKGVSVREREREREKKKEGEEVRREGEEDSEIHMSARR